MTEIVRDGAHSGGAPTVEGTGIRVVDSEARPTGAPRDGER